MDGQTLRIKEPNLSDEAVGTRLGFLLTASDEAGRHGNYATGAELARDAVGLATALADRAREAEACRLLARNSFRIGDTEAAALAGERAARLFESLGGEAEISDTLNLLTLIYTDLGLGAEALEAVTRSVAIARKSCEQQMLYWALNRSGVAHSGLGDPVQAEVFFRSALNLVNGLGDEERFCILNNLTMNAGDLAKKLRESGGLAQAAACLEAGLQFGAEACALADPATHPYRRSLGLANYAGLKAQNGELAAAIEALEEARQLAVRHGYGTLEWDALYGAACCHRTQGGLDKAAAGFETLLRRPDIAGQKAQAMKLHQQLAGIFEEIGDFAAGLRHFKRFRELEREINTGIAETRARILTNMFELENAKSEAELSRMEADLYRVETVRLEGEKRDLQSKAAELDRHAHQDALTGLWNRRYVETVLPDRLKRMTDEHRIFHIALADIDSFKAINDRFGHATGDAVLAQVAGLISKGSRQADIVARLGGDEFMIVMTGLGRAEAARACERLRAAVASHDWPELAEALAVTVSIGLAGDDANNELTAAIALADAKLYEAKRGGRNVVC